MREFRISIRFYPETTKSSLDYLLIAISNWCLDNELILNLKKGKTEFMLFGTSKNISLHPELINITYQFNEITVTTSYKYLGITLTPTLNMNTNFRLSLKKSNSRLRLLSKIRLHLNEKAAKSIYQSMILPVITYGSLLNFARSELFSLPIRLAGWLAGYEILAFEKPCLHYHKISTESQLIWCK